MIKLSKKIFFFLFSSCVLLLNAGFVFALEVRYPDILGKSLNDTSSFAEYACYLFGLGVALAIFASIISIAVGGVSYLISYFGGKFTSDAKDWIKSGLLGLLIVVSASMVAYTINPNLTKCQLAFLPKINFESSDNQNNSPGIPTTTYEEIPIGVLTENLLTGKMNCYGFNQTGDPIDGNPLTKTNMLEPTYLNHDRADCLTQLVDGAQKKSQVIAEMSDEIAKLMKKCSCANKCADTCGGNTGCNQPATCPGGSCSGLCMGPNGGCQGAADCCPPGVKDQIEHGSIVLGGQSGTPCKGDSECSTGLKCDSATDSCIPYVAPVGASCDISKPCSIGQICDFSTNTCVSSGGESGGVCNPNSDNCSFGLKCDPSSLICVPTCKKNDQNCSGYEKCDPVLDICKPICLTSTECPTGKKCENNWCVNDEDYSSSGLQCMPKKTYKGFDEFRCPLPGLPIQQCSGLINIVEKEVEVNGKKIVEIDQTKWNQLNLLQQLTYFKEKIDNWGRESKIQEDINLLNKGRSSLGKCYLAMSYVDLLKVKEATDEGAHLIAIQKFSDPTTCTPVIDPKTNEPVDSSKYCKGFNYSNSSCFKKCNDFCPDSSEQALSCYSGCAGKGSGQEKCIEDCYSARPCTAGTGGTFGQCITSCQKDCSSLCAERYSNCSEEFKFCESQCKNNSKCILDNASSCLFGSENFQKCGEQFTDQGNADYCIDNAYLCKNGSDMYAGYQDCAEPMTIKCETHLDQKTCEAATGCTWDGVKCSQNYSSSFLFGNPTYQKCPIPLNPAKPGTSCYSRSNTSSPCQENCPETAKCPSSSNCPGCSCDKLDENIKLSVPNESNAFNAGNEGYGALKNKVSAYQMVGTECNEYAYSNDPLTFYCEYGWWNNPAREGLNLEPIGAERFCPPGKEIPVGQTVDEAITWAKKLVNSATSVTDKIGLDIQKMLDQMNKIGKAIGTNDNYNYPQTVVQDYCKCGAKYETNNPICTTSCQYSQAQVLEPTCIPSAGGTGTGTGTEPGNGTTTPSTEPSTTGPSTFDYFPKNKFILATACTMINQYVSSCPSNQICKNGTCIIGKPCNYYGYCGTGEHCVSGECLAGSSCTGIGQSNCPSGQHCVSGGCVPGEGCSANGSCSTGKHCVNGECVAGTGCQNNGNCASNEHCQSGGVCAAGRGCPNDPNCSYDKHCNSAGNCVSGFACSGSCPSPNVCQNGDCVPPGTPPTTPPVTPPTTPPQGGAQGSCPTGYIQTGWQLVWKCSCDFLPCTGAPCTQMVTYHSELWNYFKQLKTDFIDFYMKMITGQGDIIKKLTYSRQATNTCSLTSSAYGSETKMFSCSRAIDEKIPPISTSSITLDGRRFNGYCYGKSLGKILDKPMTDNWFCCEKYENTSSQ